MFTTTTTSSSSPPSLPPAHSKPLPTRTESTRIQLPAPLHRSPTNPLQTQRSATKKSEKYTSLPARNPTTTTTAKPSHSSSKKNANKERPGMQPRRTTAQTRYIDMLLSLDTVPRLHNILASFCTWILLAGYIVFPATFTGLKDVEVNDKSGDVREEVKKKALDTVRNAPLLYVAGFACGIGVLGCVALWWKWRKNYVWVINRIFLPALMNSVAGLISTLVNVYSARDGQYSVTAKVTLIVTGVCSVITALLFLVYNGVMLSLVKRKHAKETKGFERSQSVRELEERREKVLGAEVGSVV
ncbi:hypothetical protein K505DRAFT_249501 [Melanomma pulvis-pyrius CBS 109.77]|uniref:Uncharacterized protein n=1 Tax=Melanomma pulvis-pyrius CBS 109.77 TaxID=1314802 RepID=A0A6A6X4F3_9PLEO|nr:hypothetical protein K505DRAFT_249501 [Melanomma pulvis-pyrius CBS 109.77]